MDSHSSSKNGNHSRNATDLRTGTEDVKRIALILFYAVTLFLGVFGNWCIIAIVIKVKRMRTMANVFILNMAVSDLVVSVIDVPRKLQIAITMSYAYEVPSFDVVKVLCKILPFTRELSYSVSSLSAVMIGIDRYYAVICPMEQKPRVLSPKVTIPAIWLISALAYSTNLYTYKATKKEGAFYCSYRWHPLPEKETEELFLLITFVLFVALPLVALVFVYALIAVKMMNRSIPGATGAAVNSHRVRGNNKIIRLSIAITTAFFICWVPYYVLLLTLTFNIRLGDESIEISALILVLADVFEALTYTSIVTNPMICLAFSTNFRQALKELMLCQARNLQANNTNRTRIQQSMTMAYSFETISMSVESVNKDVHPRRRGVYIVTP
ncbi:predicted protein [Nematostella vectensis]|uniref:G-protein coupled receptors family 1 profile domain-containing protein n=1 Tax=Nematostella vectensis TaxID=45351 RepID=A8DVC5_NEMVE|nr:QRFP-like peptide receptor [Nematostella vectensis]EDO25835.1 predicted protein [Nematostella vectensis]|eukprot:XP_001617935.1 hypothetical protein NEMVEDRAFT_v1g225653 [Nematostella vectensis]